MTAPSAGKCDIQATASPLAFPATGGQGTLTIQAERECTWTVTTAASWIAAQASNGQGPASVEYTITSNPIHAERASTLAVGDHILQLNQAAAPCRYTLSRTSASIAADGGKLSLALDTLAGCAWTAVTSDTWLSLTNRSGSASATLELTVERNIGAERVGRVNVEGQIWTVTQEAAPLPAPVPPPAPTPPPPQPPPPSEETVEVRGDVASITGTCPNVTFTVAGRTIVANSSTDYRRGKCKDLTVGRGVEVQGTTTGANESVTATRIEFLFELFD